MNGKLLFLTAVAVCVIFSAAAWAAQPSIVGIWSVPVEQGKDKGKERSQIEIFEKQGVYYARNVKLNNAPANLLCRKCRDDKKDKPILGMMIIRDLKKNGDHYTGGKILQVETGDEFSCTVELVTPDKMKLTAGWLFGSEDHYLMRVK
jgi:uncharacterized protein (DUF2147 family)